MSGSYIVVLTNRYQCTSWMKDDYDCVLLLSTKSMRIHCFFEISKEISEIGGYLLEKSKEIDQEYVFVVSKSFAHWGEEGIGHKFLFIMEVFDESYWKFSNLSVSELQNLLGLDLLNPTKFGSN